MTNLLLHARFGRGEQGNALLTEGWDAPEDGFAWATGGLSELLLPIAPPDGNLWLEIRLAPFTHPPTLPAQRLEIAVNGFPVATRTLSWPATLRLDLPPRAMRGAPDITVSFIHPDAASPNAAGAGPDTRPLAFRIERLALLHGAARNTPPAPAGPGRVTEYRFGGNDGTAAMLTEGWGEPETDYVWAIGRHSVLSLPAAAPGAMLLLDLNPYIHAPALKQQRVAIGADGHLLGYAALHQRSVLAYPLPAAASGAPRQVTFENLDAAAPRTDGLYRDGSPFSFMLCNARIVDGASHPPAETSLRPRLAGTLDDGSLQAAVHALTGDTAPDVAARFESLGSICELGLLQRRLGREPNGLLRFSGISTPTLIEGILNRFQGLGRSDTIRLHRRQDPNFGYWAEDDVFELGFQTPVSSLAVAEAEMKRQLSRALPFLAFKFFEDASAAEKIFVFQRRDVTTQPEAEAVRAALSVWGDNTVLWVQQDNARAGTARRLSARLLHGFVDDSNENGHGGDDALMSMLAQAWMLRR